MQASSYLGGLCRASRMLEAEGRVMHTKCLHIKLHLDTLQAHPETPAIQLHGKATKTTLWIERRPFLGCRSPAKESAAGQKCRRITFAELDDIVYNQLKLPLYNLDMIGIQKVISLSWAYRLNIHLKSEGFGGLLTKPKGKRVRGTDCTDLKEAPCLMHLRKRAAWRHIKQ
jgi:hypothetical protein